MQIFPPVCEKYPLPPACPNMRIGLFGGSFDPPHVGHLQVSLTALKQLGLDQVWWLVSPGNPLKEQGPWPLDRRLEQCRKQVAGHPRVKITGFENCARSFPHYSADLIAFLVQLFPRTDFIWIMGADNLVYFHKWHKWREIFDLVPVLVVDRPGYRIAAHGSVAARQMEKYRQPKGAGPALSGRDLPAWIYVSMPLEKASSTQIRAKYRKEPQA